MKLLHSLVTRFQSSGPIMGLILAISAIPIGAGLLLHYWEGVPFGQLTRDPISIAGNPPYTGFLSQLGIFFWAASAAVCLFSAQVLTRSAHPRQFREFMLVSGVLTLVLGLDDVFLIHEVFFPYIGILQNVILFGYVVFAIFYLIRFYSIILDTEYLVLGMAFVFFGVSASLDLLHPQAIDPYLLEDGAKLVGIISWLAYFFRTGAAAMNHNAGSSI